MITYNYGYKIHDFWYPPQYVKFSKSRQKTLAEAAAQAQSTEAASGSWLWPYTIQPKQFIKAEYMNL